MRDIKSLIKVIATIMARLVVKRNIDHCGEVAIDRRPTALICLRPRDVRCYGDGNAGGDGTT